MCTQPSRLVPVERLGCRCRCTGLNQRCRALDGDCAWLWSTRARPESRSARSTRSARAAAQFLPSHLHGTGYTLRRRKDTRTHAIGSHRCPAHAGNEGGRNTGIDRQPHTVHGNGAVYDASCAQKYRAPIYGHNVRAQPRRRHVASRHEHPVRWLNFVWLDQFVRRKGRPADEVIAVTPIYPRWRPFVTRHPEPANPRFERPTAVVINDPAPAGFDVIGYPVPAPFVRIDPVSVLVGPPVRWHRAGHPDLAEARMRAPAAVLLKRDLSVLGDLRYRGPDRERQEWSTQYANGQSDAGRNCQRCAAYPIDERHVCSLSGPARPQRRQVRRALLVPNRLVTG